MFHKEKRRGSGFLDKVNKLEGGGSGPGPPLLPNNCRAISNRLLITLYLTTFFPSNDVSSVCAICKI